MTTDITELAQSLKEAAEHYQSVQGIARYSKTADAKERFLELANPANIIALVEALEKAQKRINELESELSEWTDCKHDGATYYDMSGRERCGRCGADI
ncbi:TPA: ead/Ea22-like family protein [Klebsiella pneumoniae]